MVKSWAASFDHGSNLMYSYSIKKEEVKGAAENSVERK